MEESLKILKKFGADIMLLPNCDDFSFMHTENSMLSEITGFSGSAGEAFVTASGKIFLFVDPRYHIQADLTAKNGVKVVKIKMGETFLGTFEKYFPKNTKILYDTKFTTLLFLEKLKSKYEHLIGKDFAKRNESSVYNFKDFDTKNIERLKKKINSENIFISEIDDVSYLTGLRSFEMPFSSSIRAKLLITNNRNELIFLDFKKIKEKTTILSKEISVYDYQKFENPIVLSVNPVKKMMSVKSEAEIKQLKNAFERLDVGLLNFKSKIKKGLSEFELKELLEAEIFKTGAISLSFKTILSIGENTASIHYGNWDKNKILKDSDLILVDCGLYLNDGLASDITRVFTAGKPTEKQKKVYTIVLKAFLKVYNNDLKSGYELDDTARKFFKKVAPEGFLFSHALGHGVGLNVHSSPPNISPYDKKKKKLKKNMVFTLEPGLYKEGEFGIRLENTVYIDSDFKKHSFSKFPFEEKLINYGMLTQNEKNQLKRWQNGR